MAVKAMERSLSGGQGLLDSQFNAHFTAANESKDKLLNFEEYLVFIEKEKSSREIRREPEIQRTRE